MNYLAELLEEKKQLSLFPNFFLHSERLVDEEIVRARTTAFKGELHGDSLNLPDPKGGVVQLKEKIFVPVNEYPGYNFVGRILGPRGMTAKQLEQETGCKIMIRGKGSLRDKDKEEMSRGKPNFEHLKDELHVLVQCDDTKERAEAKLKSAVEQIKKLLVPPPSQGIDDLKRKQLMELSIINGTYRSPSSKYPLPAMPRLHSVSVAQPFFPDFAHPLPAFFDSPLPSPLETDISSPSHLITHCKPNTSWMPQEAFDNNVNMIMQMLKEQSSDPKEPLRLKKNPWMQDTWRNSSSSGSGDAVNSGPTFFSSCFAGGDAKPGAQSSVGAGDVGVLTCCGCGEVKTE